MEPRQVDTQMLISDLFERWPQTMSVFIHQHMACVGCTMSPFMTVADAIQIYGLDETQFLAQLKAQISGDVEENHSES